nr:hypothetical protein BOSE7B_140008 [Bosea sp. 7B]
MCCRPERLTGSALVSAIPDRPTSGASPSLIASRPKNEGQDTAIFLEDRLPDHEVGDARFVLDRHEHHAFGRAWSLSYEHQVSYIDPTSIMGGDRIGAGHNPPALEFRSRECNWMLAQSRPDVAITLYHLAARCRAGHQAADRPGILPVGSGPGDFRGRFAHYPRDLLSSRFDGNELSKHWNINRHICGMMR